MDERDQNPLTISDILDQLIKPSVIKGTEIPSPPPRPTTSPPPSLPPKPEPSKVSLPQLNKPTTPTSTPQSFDTLTNKPSDRRPTIRTMQNDLARLKQGLVPVGLEVETKKEINITQTKKLPTPIPAPTKIVTSTPPMASNNPQVPPILSREQPIPLNRPLPPKVQQPFFDQKPTTPPLPTPGRPAHIHEEVRILDKDNLPAFLGAPIPKRKAPKPEEEKVEYGVIAKIIGSGMTTGIVSTMILAIIAYALIYYFFLKEDLSIVATPTPTQVTASPSAEINELEEIFKSTAITSFTLPTDPANLLPEFNLFLEKEALAQKGFKRIRFLPIQLNEMLTFTSLLDRLAIKYPAKLNNSIKNNNLVFLYGQMEKFDNRPGTDKKIVFIAELKGAAEATEVMKSWEATMANDLKNFFSINPSEEASASFLDNERQGIKIRYKNFPNPDRTIDYAIVSSLTGRYYLIITNSRESMYSPIDKIRGI